MKGNRFVKFLLGAVLMTAAISPVTVRADSKDIQVKVDNVSVHFPDAKPFIDPSTSRTMIPVRFVSEKLGASVDWDGAKQTVIMNKDGKQISLKIGEKKAVVAGQEITFDAAATLQNNRTFVPLRFISETYGAKVEWLASERLVNITTGTNNFTNPTNGTKPSNGIGTGTNPTPSTGTNPSTGTGGSGTPFKPPIREGQAENVEAMKRAVQTFKVEDGVLKGVVPNDIKGYMLIEFNGENPNVPIVKTQYLKPGTPFELKINDTKGVIELHGQNGTAFGLVGIEYPSMEIIGGR
ncbi:stalk domain-containing protein [Brevibacillus brevis]|uniref:Stalk domain-containing protein n=1 Tax=Brevibacillus brevis TaxID=1393 RepID=A0ABY9T6B4_BREBE|nr:stalk domain-containing protein [Brevibacillus brevis]WNC15407.1 stalk domain-containing protein [Brevibacillus brevis]